MVYALTIQMIKCSKLAQKEYDWIQLNWKGGPQGIVQEIEIWPFCQMGYAQTRIHPGEWETQNSLGFWDTNWSPNPSWKTRTSDH